MRIVCIVANHLMLGFLLIGQVNAQQTEFTIDDPLGRNVVMFESKAPMETIIGTTNKVRGKISANPTDLMDSPNVEFQVDLRSLDTGIERRNQDMRNQYLETEKYPEVGFQLLKVVKVSQKTLADGQSVDIEATGTVSLHGISREETISLRATFFEATDETRTRLPGNLLRIEGSFNLDLGEYGIPIPKLVVMRLDSKITVTIDVFASDAPAEAMRNLDPCNPCSNTNACNPCSSNPCSK
jgi:polyisoprenoid-binding protein YceI